MNTTFSLVAALGMALISVPVMAAGPQGATRGNGQQAQRGDNGPGGGQCQGQGNGQGAMRGYCGGRGAGGQGPHGQRRGACDGTGPRRDGSCLQNNQ